MFFLCELIILENAKECNCDYCMSGGNLAVDVEAIATQLKATFTKADNVDAIAIFANVANNQQVQPQDEDEDDDDAAVSENANDDEDNGQPEQPDYDEMMDIEEVNNMDVNQGGEEEEEEGNANDEEMPHDLFANGLRINDRPVIGTMLYHNVMECKPSMAEVDAMLTRHTNNVNPIIVCLYTDDGGRHVFVAHIRPYASGNATYRIHSLLMVEALINLRVFLVGRGIAVWGCISDYRENYADPAIRSPQQSLGSNFLP